ncbi:MAG: GNAT family N-acetyltransferase [Micromonosporaceae bacterium]
MSSDVSIREVEDGDLDTFFDNQQDPEATRMAAVVPRDRAAFTAHWRRTRADPTTVQRTIVVDGAVAGNVVSWAQEGQRLVGYWVGRSHWGQGVATRALALFLSEVDERPLYAYVAVHNVASTKVLQKCGFERVAATTVGPDGVQEYHFTLG